MISDRHGPESAIDIDHNWRSACARIRDRHGPESLIVMRQNTHSEGDSTTLYYDDVYFGFDVDESRAVSGIVDSGDNVGLRSSIVLDSEDKPHIAYSATVTDVVMLASWNGTVWTRNSIDHYQSIRDVSLERLNDDVFYISYVSSAAGKGLRLALFDISTQSMQFDDVDDSQNAGLFSSLAQTSTGSPRLCQLRGQPGRGLYYMEPAAGVWQSESVINIPGGVSLGSNCSLALDDADSPSMVFYRRVATADKGMLIYATPHENGNSNFWVLEEVDTIILDANSGTSLVTDKNNAPHVSYSQYDAFSVPQKSELRYATLGASGWVTTTVATGGLVWGSSIALNSLGHPSISYYKHEGGAYSAHYASWDGNLWTDVTIASWNFASPTLIDSTTSIAMDSRRRVHVSYYDPVNGNLLYYTDP